MDTNLYLLRYGEISLRSEKIRTRMEASLRRNLHHQFARKNLPIKIVDQEFGRIIVDATGTSAADFQETIQHVLGVVSFSPVIKTSRSLKALSLAFLDFARPILEKWGSSFEEKYSRSPKLAIRVRVSMVPPKPEEISRLCFEKLTQIPQFANYVFSLKDPDYTFYIEHRLHASYLYHERIECPAKGLPIEDRKAVFSIDFGRASDFLTHLLIMRRGVHVLTVRLQTTENSTAKKSAVFAEHVKNLHEFYPQEAFFSLNINYESILKRIQKRLKKIVGANQEFSASDFSCAICTLTRFFLLEELLISFEELVVEALFQFGEFILTSNLLMPLSESQREKVLHQLQNAQNESAFRKILSPYLLKYEAIGTGLNLHTYCPFSGPFMQSLASLSFPLLLPTIGFSPEQIAAELSHLPLSYENAANNVGKQICKYRTPPKRLASLLSQNQYLTRLQQIRSIFKNRSWLKSLFAHVKFDLRTYS